MLLPVVDDDAVLDTAWPQGRWVNQPYLMQSSLCLYLTFGVIFRMYLNLLCLDSEKSRNMRIDFAGRLWRGHHASRKWATVGKTQAAPEYFFVVRISGFPGNPANGANIRNLGSLSMSDPPFIYHDFAPFSLTANWFLPPRFLMMVHFGRRQWMKKEP